MLLESAEAPLAASSGLSASMTSFPTSCAALIALISSGGGGGVEFLHPLNYHAHMLAHVRFVFTQDAARLLSFGRRIGDRNESFKRRSGIHVQAEPPDLTSHLLICCPSSSLTRSPCAPCHRRPSINSWRLWVSPSLISSSASAPTQRR